MEPVDLEEYRNGDVTLKIRHGGDTTTYWIQAGVGAIEFRQSEWMQLIELLMAYAEEMDRDDGPHSNGRTGGAE